MEQKTAQTNNLVFQQGIVTTRAMLELSNETDTAYLIDQWLPEFGITFLYGSPGVGKTWVCLEMAKAIAQGSHFLGKFKAKQNRVLIIDEESGIRQMARRCKLMEYTPDLTIDFMSQNGVRLDDKEWIERIVQYINETEVGVLILDPLSSFHNADENSSSDMMKVMAGVQEISLTGCSVIIVHHSRKGVGSSGQNLRGSSALMARADSTIFVEPSGKNIKDEMVISQQKNRNGMKAEAIKVTLVQNGEGAPISLLYEGSAEHRLMKAELAKRVVADILKETPLTRKELIKKVCSLAKCGQRNAADAIKALSDEAEIGTETKDGKKFYYLLA